MPWTHDPDANTLHCISAKHGRETTVSLPTGKNPGAACKECSCQCTFAWVVDPMTGSERIVLAFAKTKAGEG